MFNTRQVEPYRVRYGPMGSTESFGCNGQFVLPVRTLKRADQPSRLELARGAVALRDAWRLNVQISDQLGWEHLSCSTPTRCPTWDEMAFVAGLFWDKEDTLIQYRPPLSDYINVHQFCLHWFRPIGIDIPIPPSILIG
jgi:hypothetical protein